ncbi:MAG TPA: MBL fold metallo-hydrolase [Spirochaetia bacterium]|nr:MBL fold metallo-hydrolase [Spirochaetia bacterium]
MVERVIVGPWKTNCYIYSSSKKECIIIDPGGDETEIASRVDVLNMVPVGIALTHGHVDHLAALGRLRESYAARGYTLPIGISPADRKFLGTGAIETHKESLKSHEIDEFDFFSGDTPELPKADVRLREGDRVFNMDLVVLETPGHTPGSLCFYSEKEGILFSGDTLFFDNVGRTDLPGGSDKKLRDSIQKKIAVLPPETRVFPGHGPFTTVERERRGNPFFREAPAEPRRPEPVMPARPSVSRDGRPAAAQTGRTAPRAQPVRGKPRTARPVKAVKALRRALARTGRALVKKGSALTKKRPAAKPARGSAKTSAAAKRRSARPAARRTVTRGTGARAARRPAQKRPAPRRPARGGSARTRSAQKRPAKKKGRAGGPPRR